MAYDVIGQSYYPQWHGTLANGTSPFPLTDAGQERFLDSVNQIVRDTPNNPGKGVMWWEPTAGNGTRNLFDSDGNAKPAIAEFDYAAGIRILLQAQPFREVTVGNPRYFLPDGRRAIQTGTGSYLGCKASPIQGLLSIRPWAAEGVRWPIPKLSLGSATRSASGLLAGFRAP